MAASKKKKIISIRTSKKIITGDKKKKKAKIVPKKAIAIRVSKKTKIANNKTFAKKPKKLKILKKKKFPIELERAVRNPIIEPENNISWESKATFNPSAIYHDGKVHIVYRAIGDSDNSVIGYAMSKDGIKISERFHFPIYGHYMRANRDVSLPAISYISGGGWGGGCEDPRLTLLGDRVYMLYTAFDGWGSVRIALTSISLNDFVSRRFKWKEPVLISPPGEIHKNWVLFPEKIGGKYAIMHSFAPKILINYFDNLNDLDGKKFIKSNNKRPIDTTRTWDSWFRGVGPSPIKTKYGWLVIYHAMDHRNPDRYRIGAMILDLKNPTKVLYRSKEPILEPDEWYENEGYKSGVVYTCGAVVKDGELFVYYGGADKVTCVATANLDKFLEELINSSNSKLKTKKSKA
ncbi:MAG: hypothetical protein WCP17_01115 [bacterium]